MVRLFETRASWEGSTFSGPTPPYPGRRHRVDVRIEHHGSLFLMRLQTRAASQWVQENVSQDATWFGEALVVEPRYVGDLVDAMKLDGLSLS